MVPENKKAEYYKDASKALDVMNKVTGGKAVGVQGGGTQNKEFGTENKKDGTVVAAATSKSNEATSFANDQNADFSDTPSRPITKENHDDAAQVDDLSQAGRNSKADVQPSDAASANVRTGSDLFADDAQASLVRQHTKDTTKIPAIFKRNVLHKYSSYTYHIELFILGVDDYNQFIDNEEFAVEDLPGRLLIKSGGGNQKNRNKYFQLDYFIDNLEIESVISPSAGNQGSTNTNISFTVTEPYGMTLLNGLVMASKDLGGYNYTNQPYLLKVSFKGYDDDGKVIEDKNKNSTRYIPIKINKFNFGATQEGTTYEVEGVVYHSMALENTKATIKTDVRLDATTIADFLTEQITTITRTAGKVLPVTGLANNNHNDFGGSTESSMLDEDDDETVEAIERGPIQTYKTEMAKTAGGLAGYMNQIEQQQVEQGTKTHADEYAFQVDPDIAKATINVQSIVDVRKIKNENDASKKGLGQFAANFNFDEITQHYSIRAGTNILNVIHSVIRTSTFMTNQVKADNLAKSKDKEFSQYKENEDTPVNFYRIVPRVTLLDKWDNKRNCFARRITFVIKKYNMYGKDYENFGQAPIKDVVKEYKYLYTGRNDDIINFDIQFNTAYYQKNIYQIANKAKSTPSEKAFFQPSDFPEGNLAKTDLNALSVIAPIVKEASIDTGTSKGISDPRVDPRAMLVDNMMADIFKTGADLMEINLELVGDPSFIHQHDMRKVALMTYEAPPYFKDNSLNPDREWHLSLSFRNPVDIDTDTGLYHGFGINEDGKKEVTAPTMNGIYKAVEVVSKFDAGKFTQSVKAIRERGRQVTDFVESDEVNKKVENIKEVNEKVDDLVKKVPDAKVKIAKSIIDKLMSQNNVDTDADAKDEVPVSKNEKEGAIAKGESIEKITPKETVNKTTDSVDAVGGEAKVTTPPAEKVVKKPPVTTTPKLVESKPKLPPFVTPDRVTGGWRAVGPDGRARGFAYNDLAGAKAYASGG